LYVQHSLPALSWQGNEVDNLPSKHKGESERKA
jgi:hypothetical protein